MISTGKNAVATPGFSLILEDRDGKLSRRTYAFEGYRVRLTAKIPYQAPVDPAEPLQIAQTHAAEDEPSPSLADRLRRRFSAWKEKLSGR
jgi:hypothetical protein